MFFVDDVHVERRDLERHFLEFERHPILGKGEGKRLAVRVCDPAIWLALLLHVKARGGSVFPFHGDVPLEAVRRRAERSGADHLIVGESGGKEGWSIERMHVQDVQLKSPWSGLVQATSGTTGEPRFIVRSWESIDEEVDAYLRHFSSAQTATPIVACPVNHSYGLISGVLVAMAREVEPVIITNPNPKYIVRRIRETERPLLYSSPALLLMVAALTREDSPIFGVMTSGTTLSKTALEGVRVKTRHLHQQYGCSEVGCITLGEDIQVASDVGSVLPHLRVEAGPSVAEPGEINVRTAAGCVETRDLGYFEGARLHFVARADDMINVSGFNVYPSEVEEIVLEMPGITDAVVYKRSSALGGDQVCLSFCSEHELPGEQIREWCATRLAGYQVPLSIARVESIPRLPNGKVSRKALSGEMGHSSEPPRALP